MKPAAMVRVTVRSSSTAWTVAPGGTAYLYEYDAAKKSFRLLLNTTKYLREHGQIPPEAKYSPGEIQTRIDMGSDGWLYYGTTRGSTTATTDANGKGDAT